MNGFRRASLVFSLSALVAVTGCSSKEKETTSTAAPAKGGPVVAEVNGATITLDEFRREIENLPPYLRPMTETVEGRKEMLETMIIRELILQDAAKEKLDDTPQIREKLADLKKRLVVETYLKKKVDEKAVIGDDEIKKFYEENKEKFKHGEQIRASHILVKDEAKLAEVQAALKKGEPFDQVAKKYSTDGAASRGGDLEWFGRGTMDPEFEKVAFSLKEGEVSSPVKTKFGIHVIKLTGKRPAGVSPVEEVKDRIRQALLPQKQKEVFDRIKEDLKKGAKYSIKDEVVSKMDVSPQTPKKVEEK